MSATPEQEQDQVLSSTDEKERVRLVCSSLCNKNETQCSRAIDNGGCWVFELSYCDKLMAPWEEVEALVAGWKAKLPTPQAATTKAPKTLAGRIEAYLQSIGFKQQPYSSKKYSKWIGVVNDTEMILWVGKCGGVRWGSSITNSHSVSDAFKRRTEKWEASQTLGL